VTAPRRALRLVRAPARPSVVVDMTATSPRFTSPLAMAEILATQDAVVPNRVFVGMYAAAWAHAEACPLVVVDGRLEVGCRYDPTEALLAATARGARNLVGVLGFGVPVRRDDDEQARWVVWPDAHWWGGN
jgi:hypothetical protein